MLLKIISICCMCSVFILLIFGMSPVFAIEEPTGTSGSGININDIPTIEQANKYLSAEATKQIKSMKEEILNQLQANDDANFQQLDARMNELMADVRMKVVLAALGVTLLANGFGVYFLIRSFRENSYEAYLEKRLEATKADLRAATSQEGKALMQELQYSERDMQGLQEQQGVWQQPPPSSYGAQIGQVAVSQQSMMNEWQTEPVYAGAWQSPVQTLKEYGTHPEEEREFEQAAQEFVELHKDPYEAIPDQDSQGEVPQPWDQQNQGYGY